MHLNPTHPSQPQDPHHVVTGAVRSVCSPAEPCGQPPERPSVVQFIVAASPSSTPADSTATIRNPLVSEEPAFGTLEFAFDHATGVLTVRGRLPSRYLRQQVTARALCLPIVRGVRNLIEIAESYSGW